MLLVPTLPILGSSPPTLHIQPGFLEFKLRMQSLASVKDSELNALFFSGSLESDRQCTLGRGDGSAVNFCEKSVTKDALIELPYCQDKFDKTIGSIRDAVGYCDNMESKSTFGEPKLTEPVSEHPKTPIERLRWMASQALSSFVQGTTNERLSAPFTVFFIIASGKPPLENSRPFPHSNSAMDFEVW